MAEENAYPKDKNSNMKAVDSKALGKVTKETTEAGPYLKQGKGTQYNQATLGKGFLVHNPHPGHKQEKNIESEEHN